MAGRNAAGFPFFDRACPDGGNLGTSRDTRPALCRNYPPESLYCQGGRLPDGCGPACRDVTFRDVLTGRKPFKPADFSAVLRREIQQEKDKQT
ncbi:hypothetical protein [Pseudodesulfovibrio methanolicus]|uniref:Uncharacterized protein n=1 Tax=Pseudodesulfovibrio methanolicus TaxID=3126690 RepID=A0ABZ2IVV8_9BACT